MRIAGVLIISLFLQGCANVAMSGAQAVYNRHSIQKNISDEYTTLKAYQALNKHHDSFKESNISIATFNDELLIIGQVSSSWQKFRVEQLVKQVANVEEIHNLLTISKPPSSLTELSDIWITAKIKTKLILSNDVDVTQVKVVTENSTVYLMGILFPSEAQAAVDLASNTDGVARIIKVFKYIKICRVD